MLPEPTVAVASYTELRVALTGLLADVPDDDAATVVVPACPDWTVTDTVAHLYGVCVDILDGNLAEAGTKDWADAQVARFSGEGLTNLLDGWNAVGPSVEELAPAFPASTAAQFVFDAATHAQDIRGALSRPGDREAGCVLVGLSFLEASLDGYVRSNGLPTLTLTSPSWSTVAGDGPAEVEVEASTFELFRSFGGRRSVEQVRALAWTGDPEPYLGMLDGRAAIGLRAEPLIE